MPIKPEGMERAKETALALARRIGDELGLPVFLYGELAPGRGPAFFRKGGPEELQRRDRRAASSRPTSGRRGSTSARAE